MDEQTSLVCCFDGTVAPDCGGWQSRRQNLLNDLSHGDFVVIYWLATFLIDSARSRHDRRDQERRHEPGNEIRVKQWIGGLSHQLLDDPFARKTQSDACGANGFDEMSARIHEYLPFL
jgi:hypothetical protein